MSIADDLNGFYSAGIANVVDDSDKFRKKLQIGGDAFRYLSNAENLGNFLTTIGGGAGLASLSYFGWYASMGVLSQIGLAVGLVSTPVGWFAAAGAGGVATVYGVRRIFRTIKKEAVTEVPNFINSPIDILADSICALICPILLKIAYADNDYSNHERDNIRNYFTMEWGINADYIDDLIRNCKSSLIDFNYEKLVPALKEIEKSGDIKYSTISNEIINISTIIISCDGHIHEDEKKELEKISAIFKG